MKTTVWVMSYWAVCIQAEYHVCDLHKSSYLLCWHVPCISVYLMLKLFFFCFLRILMFLLMIWVLHVMACYLLDETGYCVYIYHSQWGGQQDRVLTTLENPGKFWEFLTLKNSVNFCKCDRGHRVLCIIVSNSSIGWLGVTVTIMCGASHHAP